MGNNFIKGEQVLEKETLFWDVLRGLAQSMPFCDATMCSTGRERDRGRQK